MLVTLLVSLGVVRCATTAFPQVEWKLKDGVDAVPGVTAHTKHLGETSTVDECQQLCSQLHECNVFTWNRVVKPHNCFGGIDDTVHWKDTANPHCISGCRGDACGRYLI